VALNQPRRGLAGQPVELRAEERLQPPLNVEASLKGPMQEPAQSDQDGVNGGSPCTPRPAI
jgi:hypothetical protein